MARLVNVGNRKVHKEFDGMLTEYSVYINEHTKNAAKMSAGSVLVAIEAVLDDSSIDKASTVNRPPGYVIKLIVLWYYVLSIKSVF